MIPRVRLATVRDISALVEMRRDFTFEGQPTPEVLRDDYEDAMGTLLCEGMKAGTWFVFVADAGGQLVSHIYVHLVAKLPRPVPDHQHIGYVTNVYTRPAYRGEGIGGQILDEIRSWARRQSVELLFVWPSEASVEFYRRHGFDHPPDLLVWEAD